MLLTSRKNAHQLKGREFFTAVILYHKKRGNLTILEKKFGHMPLSYHDQEILKLDDQ